VFTVGNLVLGAIAALIVGLSKTAFTGAALATKVVNPPVLPYTAAVAGVGRRATVRRTILHTWITTIASTLRPITMSIGRVDDPTIAKKAAPTANPTLTDTTIGRSRSHRAWRLNHVTAKTSAASNIGRVVPGINRPLTIVAMSGVATKAAPGNAVFDNPTISAAIAPSTRLPTVNTGAA